MEVAHIDAWRRDPDRFWRFYGDRFASLVGQAPERGAPGAGGARAARPDQGGDHPEHRPPAPRGRHRAADRGARLDRAERLPASAAARCRSTAWSSSCARTTARPSAPACIAPLKPDVVLFGELLPERALAEAQALALEADLMVCVGSSLEVYPVAGAAGDDARRAAGGWRSSPRARRRTTPTPRSSSTATWSTSCGRCWRRCEPASTAVVIGALLVAVLAAIGLGDRGGRRQRARRRARSASRRSRRSPAASSASASSRFDHLPRVRHVTGAQARAYGLRELDRETHAARAGGSRSGC